MVVDLNTDRTRHTVSYDIALIKTSSKIHLNACVRPIDLNTDDVIRGGRHCYLAGWGETHIHSGIYIYYIYIYIYIYISVCVL